MWTRNYYNGLNAFFLSLTNSTSTDVPTDYTPPIRVRMPDGNYRTCSIQSSSLGGQTTQTTGYTGSYAMGMSPIKQSSWLISNSNPSSSSQNNGSNVIVFGNGTDAESYEDYKLSNTINSGLSLVSTGNITPTVYDSTTHKYSCSRKLVFNHPGSTPVTITEMGIIAPIANFYSVGQNYGGYQALIYRQLFEEPITLGEAESLIIELTINNELLNYQPYPQA